MQAYHRLLKDILAEGESHSDRTGVGTTSIFGYQFQHDMRTGFPLLTTKKLPFRWIVEELKWFLSGSTNEKELALKGVDIWKEWATPEQTAKFNRKEGDLGPVYGALWRSYPVGSMGADSGSYPCPDCNKDWGHSYCGTCGGRGTLVTHHPVSIDQVAVLLKDMKETPNSRRLIVSGWHPYYQKRVALPPCHTLWQVKCHGDTEASLHLYARSIDAFLGLPFNIASYALLLELLCALTNRKPRKLIISFGDLHIYNNHIEQVNLQLSREPRNLPFLVLDVKSLADWNAEVKGYKPHPAIKAEVAV